MNTLQIALWYYGRGWNVIPIRPGTKKPVGRWEAFQSERPADEAMRKWWTGTKSGRGIAVILGDVSGGLICRDFDRMESYTAWATAFPKLAKELPTVETSRGRHVYCRGDVAQIRAVRGNTILTLADGELRGGGYCLLPPSKHPSERVYKWLNPLNGELPFLDLMEAGLMTDFATEMTERDTDDRDDGGQQRITETTEAIKGTVEVDADRPATPPPNGKVVSVVSVPLCGTPNAVERIELAIVESLPRGPGQRNKQVFELCRALKAIPSIAGADAADLKPYVRRWHELAKPVIQTPAFEDTWFDFLRGWPRVLFPKGTEPMSQIFAAAVAAELPEAALQYDSAQCRLLVVLCRELQRAAGDGPFYLSARTAGRLLGVDFKAAWRWLFVLQSDNVLKVVTRGNTRTANRYRYLKEI